VDAATILVREVMPLVWREVPDARVVLAGSEAPPAVLGLASDLVDVLGYVPDLAPVYARARMSVNPLRFGSGVKGKIIASLAAGVPVVTTPIGNEGIGLCHGVDGMIASHPADLAAQIVTLYRDVATLHRLSSEGRRVIKQRWSVDQARIALEAALNGGPEATGDA
jgi:glycosyltransferase involved in cell wall biosynthesis